MTKQLALHPKDWKNYRAVGRSQLGSDSIEHAWSCLPRDVQRDKEKMLAFYGGIQVWAGIAIYIARNPGPGNLSHRRVENAAAKLRALRDTLEKLNPTERKAVWNATGRDFMRIDAVGNWIRYLDKIEHVLAQALRENDPQSGTPGIPGIRSAVFDLVITWAWHCGKTKRGQHKFGQGFTDFCHCLIPPVSKVLGRHDFNDEDELAISKTLIEEAITDWRDQGSNYDAAWLRLPAMPLEERS
jgi:hypothetical protein